MASESQCLCVEAGWRHCPVHQDEGRHLLRTAPAPTTVKPEPGPHAFEGAGHSYIGEQECAVNLGGDSYVPCRKPKSDPVHVQPGAGSEPAVEPWRVGRKVGRTLYRGDALIGLMDTRELAAQVVEAVNAAPERARLEQALRAAVYCITNHSEALGPCDCDQANTARAALAPEPKQ